MNELNELFDSFIMKVIVMTEDFLEINLDEMTEVENFTSNRDRLLGILDHLSAQIDWEKIQENKRVATFKKIEYIKKLDDQVIERLQEHQKKIKLEIEQTVKNKDRLKGYNLSVVK